MITDPWSGNLDETDEDGILFPCRKGNLYNMQYYMWRPQHDQKLAERRLDWMRKFYHLMSRRVSKNPRTASINFKDLDLGWKKGGRANYSRAGVWGKKTF